jgi:hypothetical protein
MINREVEKACRRVMMVHRKTLRLKLRGRKLSKKHIECLKAVQRNSPLTRQEACALDWRFLGGLLARRMVTWRQGQLIYLTGLPGVKTEKVASNVIQLRPERVLKAARTATRAYRR